MSDEAGEDARRDQAGGNLLYHIAGHGQREADSENRRRELEQGRRSDQEAERDTAHQARLPSYLELARQLVECSPSKHVG